MNIVPTTPLTSVKVLNGIKFNSSYTDTLFFNSVSEQTSYFSGKSKFSFDNLTPIRLQNKIRLPKPADALYDCSYLMFKNANFGNKWFYAFIKAIDYVNTNMCELTIELDVIQTWFFECNSYSKQQYILRETPPTSEQIGDNILPENIELSDYVCNDFVDVVSETPVYIVLTTFDATGSVVNGSIKGGIYNGLDYWYSTKVNDVNSLLSDINTAGKSDGIVAVIQTLLWIFASDTQTSPRLIQKTHSIGDNLDGYVPRRKKLFTYPYYFCGLSSPNQFQPYKYEFFSSGSATFNFYGCQSTTPSILCVPTNYKGKSQNIDESAETPVYVQCAFATDAFKAWLAQNAWSLIGSVASTVAGAALSGVTGGLSLPLVGVGVQTSIEAIQNSIKPPKLQNPQNYNSYIATGNISPVIGNYSINAQYARCIDWYFEKFGYSINKVKAIGFNHNNYWHYVQTMNSDFNGNVSFEDLAKINSIFDKGIRFWYDDDIGNYREGN